GRRLAGAVGAEEAEHLAAADLERHPIDGHDRAIPFAELVDFDHGHDGECEGANMMQTAAAIGESEPFRAARASPRSHDARAREPGGPANSHVARKLPPSGTFRARRPKPLPGMVVKHERPGGDGGSRQRFAWHETAAVLRELERDGARLVPVPRGFSLVDAAGRPVGSVRLPAVLRVPLGAPADAVVAAAGQPLGDELVLLLRAGAAALGWWRDGELRAHKTFARYVVRGHGKAQPTWLSTRGKSRYGSRPRLQDALRLRPDENERCNARAAEAAGVA